MGGLLILFLAGLYLWGAYKVVRWVKPVWEKALVVVAVVLIPTADAVYGRIKLNQMCGAEGGLRIYRTVEGVEGFYESSRPDETWILKYNFVFVEGEGLLNGRVVTDRLALRQGSSIDLEKNVEQRSKYRFRINHGNHSDLFMRTEFIVETTDHKELLGRITDFNYAGGWVERLIAGIYAQRGSAGTCGLKPYVRELHRDLVLATLKPSNQMPKREKQ